MALTPSTMRDLGTSAPDFSLPTPDGKTVSRRDFVGKPLLIMFICNHCPFVKKLRSALATLGKEYQEKGIAIVGINSNDAINYPDDSPAKMKDEIRIAGYTFPYVFDETQTVAKAYMLHARPISFFTTRTTSLRTEGNSTTAGPRTASRSLAPTFVRHWTRFWLTS